MKKKRLFHEKYRIINHYTNIPNILFKDYLALFSAKKYPISLIKISKIKKEVSKFKLENIEVKSKSKKFTYQKSFLNE